MERKGMTKNEADGLCTKYQNLVGEKYSIDLLSDLLVKYVTVAPYDEINKYIFITQYKDTGSFEEALALYGGTLFDVIVVSSIISDKIEVLFTDLETFLVERNRVFDMSAQKETDLPESEPI